MNAPGAMTRSQRAVRTGTAFVTLLLLAASAWSAVPDKKKHSPKYEPYALLYGTVFDQNGRMAAGVDVRVREKEGKRHWEAVTNGQGEFVVHLPVPAAVYIVEAGARGFTAEPKEVRFTGGSDERQDVALQLAAEQKGSK